MRIFPPLQTQASANKTARPASLQSTAVRYVSRLLQLVQEEAYSIVEAVLRLPS